MHVRTHVYVCTHVYRQGKKTPETSGRAWEQGGERWHGSKTSPIGILIQLCVFDHVHDLQVQKNQIKEKIKKETPQIVHKHRQMKLNCKLS